MIQIRVLIFVCLGVMPCFGEYGGGSGTVGDPYQIADANDLILLGETVGDYDKAFVLVSDIDLSDYTYSNSLIAPYPGSGGDFGSHVGFTGVFDGQNHVIANLTIIGEVTFFLGLFGVIDVDAEVRNLRLGATTVTGLGDSNYVGGLAGLNSGTITNCHAVVNITADDVVGGLVGANGFGTLPDFSAPGGKIVECSATGDVGGDARAPDDIGGLVGSNSGRIERSFAICSVRGSDRIGGLVGSNGGRPGPAGSILNSYAGGSVSADATSGGLIGGCRGFGEPTGSVVNCYAFASVSGGLAGGLVGWYERGLISESFWDVQASDLANMCGYGLGYCDDSYGKITDQMQQQSTFTHWDFVGESTNGTTDIWRMCLDGVGYPRLSWEFGADYFCPDGVSVEDLVYLASRWLESGLEPFTSADRTGDGVVGLEDFGVLSREWGSE